MSRSIKTGKLVRYTAKFLRSAGIYSGEPINGLVIGCDDRCADVVWCDQAGEVDEYAFRVLLCNLELFPDTRNAIYPGLVVEFIGRLAG